MALSLYILRRLLLAAVVLASLSVVTFTIARVVPSDPAALYAGQRARAEQIAAAREKLGLDRPLYRQYLDFMRDALRGDFGISFKTKRPILQDILILLPATLELVIASTLLAFVIGIPAGVWAAAKAGGGFDQASRIIAIAGVSVPAFWLALMLQLLFFRWLGWLPLSGRVANDTALFNPIQPITGFFLLDAALTGNWRAGGDAAWHLVLPALTLAAYPVGLTLRMTRATMREVLREQYIVTARAQGFPEALILFRYALKNALAPTLTVLGLTLAYSLTGAVLVEVIFAWPGLGRYLTEAVLGVDFPVIVAVTLIVTVFYVLIHLIVDLLQAMLDPRVVLR